MSTGTGKESPATAEWSARLRQLWEAANKPVPQTIKRQAARQVPRLNVSPSSWYDWLSGKNVPSNERLAQWLISYLRSQALMRDRTFTTKSDAEWSELWKRAKAETAERRRNGGRRPASSTSMGTTATAGTAVSDSGLSEARLVDALPLTNAIRGLPRRSSVFEGRADEIEQLLALLRSGGGKVGRPAVGVVTGLPGAGKTELAVQAAYAALEKGWFPGGALFIDVQGYDREGALTAEAALDEMLRMMDVEPEYIPAGKDRSRLFASIMARYAAAGQPILVVIDNVASAPVAEALVAVVGATLLTSRNALAKIPGQRIDVNELSEGAAVRMLDGELREARVTDARIDEQTEDARAIARLCGRLPLALHIIAALLIEDVGRPLASMASALRNAERRLDEMRYREDVLAQQGVRAAFDLSVHQLNDEQKRVLRLLPINVGQEVSTEAVAAMAELDVDTARHRLEELRGAHLIKPGASYGQHGRWRMHDLIRLYVAGLPASPDQLPFAFTMLLLHYLEHVQAAADYLNPVGPRRSDDLFADRAQALEWLDAEYPNLIPYGHVIPIEPAESRMFTADLFLALWRYFELRRRTDDWITFTTHALTVARGFGDRGRECEALAKLGNALRQARRFDEAIDTCREAVAAGGMLGDPHSQGIALNNLTAALVEAERYDEAAEAAEQAAAIFGEIEDGYRKGIALANLGGALTKLGRHTDAAAASGQAAQIFRERGDLRGEAAVLTNLGHALLHSGGTSQDALDLQRQAVAALAEAGDPRGQGVAHCNLSVVLFQAGRYAEAVDAARDAVALLRDSNDPYSLGAALTNLSSYLQETGQDDLSISVLAEAAAVYQGSGDLGAEAEVLAGLGARHRDREVGIAHLRRAADLYHTIPDPRGEAGALRDLASVLGQTRQRGEAAETLRAAMAISGAAGDLEGRARALSLYGLLVFQDDADEGTAAIRESAKLFRQAGCMELAETTKSTLQAVETVKRAMDTLDAWMAAGRFEDVIADYESSQFRHDANHGAVGMAALDLGTALVQAGRSGQAVKLLEEAAANFQEARDADGEHAARTELEAARTAQRAAQDAAEALERALRSGDATGNDSTLASSIEEAVRHLGTHDRRFFRLLTANPGPDISLPAAAILAVADPDVVRRRLQELSGLAIDRDHRALFARMTSLYRGDAEIARGALGLLARMRLVTQDLASGRRWRIPEAIRPFAQRQGREHAAQDLRGSIHTLLSLYYCAGGNDASRPIDAGGLAPATVDEHAASLAWLTEEYPNLVATVREASNDDLGAVIALDLTRSLTHIMSFGRHFDDAVELNRIARRAAQRLHDRQGEAVVLRNLGSDLLATQRLDEAARTLRAALAIYRELGDRRGEGSTLTNLGGALTESKQFAEADAALSAALEIHHTAGHSFNEAVARASLGFLRSKTGRFTEAVTELQAADRIYRKLGDHHRRAGTLAQLADALHLSGHDEQATTTYRRAATLARVAGDPTLAKFALSGLAKVLLQTGQLVKADTEEITTPQTEADVRR